MIHRHNKFNARITIEWEDQWKTNWEGWMDLDLDQTMGSWQTVLNWIGDGIMCHLGVKSIMYVCVTIEKTITSATK